RRRCRRPSNSWPRWPATGTAPSARSSTTSTGPPAAPPPAGRTQPEDTMADHRFPTTFATVRTATMTPAVTATLGLAAACWGIAVWQMHGMDMGVATRLGSFASFIAVWVVMMTAMMLPGAAPAVLRRAQAGAGVRSVPLFIGSYLAVWALV